MPNPYIIGLKGRKNRIAKKDKSIFQKRPDAKKHQSSADQEGKYTAEVEALESRIDTVTGDLYLDDDGSFNHEKLIAGFDNGLQGNLDRYKARSDDLQLEIEEDIETTVNIPTTVNPKRKY